MTWKISRCYSCGQYFDAKRLLREHIDKNHRITNSKIRVVAKHAVILILDVVVLVVIIIHRVYN